MKLVDLTGTILAFCKNSHKARVAGLLAVSAITLSTQRADASHTRSYAGAWCTYSTGGGYALFGGTIMNPSSTTDTQLECPIVGFIGDGPANGSVDGWTARVFDRSNINDVACSLIAETASGGSVSQVFDTHTSSGFGANFQSIGTGSGLGSTMIGEYFYFACTIPHSTNNGFSHVVDFAVSAGPNI